MKYKCIVADHDELWLTVGKLYDGEAVVSPVEFSGGVWLLVKRADDGFPAYCRINQFVEDRNGDLRALGV